MNSYYYKLNEEQKWKGPYSYESLLLLNIPDHTPVWKEGMKAPLTFAELVEQEELSFEPDEVSIEDSIISPHENFPSIQKPDDSSTELSSAQIKHASFGIRFLAWFIDTFILFCVYSFFWNILNLQIPEKNSGALWGTLIIFSNPILYLFSGFYFAFFESWKLQATPGKIITGLKVTNEEYDKISFLNAVGRYLGKVMSGLIFCIGFLLIPITKNKQGFHDQMAKTFVTRKNVFTPRVKKLSYYLVAFAFILFLISFIIQIISEYSVQ